MVEGSRSCYCQGILVISLPAVAEPPTALQVCGPSSTVYEGGVFKLSVHLPDRYAGASCALVNLLQGNLRTAAPLAD